MATSKTAQKLDAPAADAGKGDKKKKVVVRSPKYPSLTFKEAADKAKVVYQHEHRAPTTPLVLYQHLGFKKKTGPAGRQLSALSQYGLLEKKGAASYSISEKAFRLFNLPEDSAERGNIERELAMRPPLFKEIVAKYRTTGLPSDSTLKSYLVIDREFNANSVAEFLKVFKAAISIAKPFDSDYTPPADDPADDDDEEEEDEHLESFETPPEQTQARVSKGNTPPPPPAGQLPFPLYLSKTEKAMLYVPASLTRKQYDLLKQQIQNSYTVMEATILADEDAE